MAKDEKNSKKKKNECSGSKYFINKHISLLQFHHRVLLQAKAPENPLRERFKFLAIGATNLDEFFMVKIGAIYDQRDENKFLQGDAGLTAPQALERVSNFAHEFVKEQYEIYANLCKELYTTTGVELCTMDMLTLEEHNALDAMFFNYIYPVVTPLAVDASRPFPLVQSGSVNIGLTVTVNGEHHFATVQMPQTLPRLVKTNPNANCSRYVFLEDIMLKHIEDLFTGCEITDVCVYRITRDADLPIEETSTDVLMEIERSIRKRKWGETMRLEVQNINSEVVEYLKAALNIENLEIYEINGPISLAFCMKLAQAESGVEQNYPVFVPVTSPELAKEEIYQTISKKDVMLHHPYDSFEPVVDFILKAASDPTVLAIKQTLYRVSGNSPIVKALAQAAENGKQVTVLLEVKARFDEENNIHWAKRLERAGCHVIYGLVGLKTHSKITLVVKLQDGTIKRYMHFGTGNYNDVTAKLYTDISLFTSNVGFGEDATAVFNMLTGFSQRIKLNSLTMAPHNLRNKFIKLIRREAEHAREGKPAHIIAKANGLTDRQIAEELYNAAKAGVKIELIIRGMCVIFPNPEGDFLHPIRIISIVGRYLEHSRIFYFENNGNKETYISSADLMSRNLDHRVELLVPVNDEQLKQRVIKMLKDMLSDNVKARQLENDGSYVPVVNGEEPMDCQNCFIQKALKIGKEGQQPLMTQFIPIIRK